MNWRHFTLLTLLGGCLRLPAGDSAGLELTGVVAVGDLRLACLKVSPGGPGLVLREGQTVGGLTLRELDAPNGQVLVAQGTNLIQLHLGSRAPEGTAQAEARARLEQHHAAMQAAEQQLLTAVTMPDDAITTTLSQPFPAAGMTATATAEASTVAPTAAAAVTSNSDPSDSTSSNRRQLNIKTVTDPEGDRVRGLLGTQAFLAWDLAHADRWQQKPTQ